MVHFFLSGEMPWRRLIIMITKMKRTMMAPAVDDDLDDGHERRAEKPEQASERGESQDEKERVIGLVLGDDHRQDGAAPKHTAEEEEKKAIIIFRFFIIFFRIRGVKQIFLKPNFSRAEFDNRRYFVIIGGDIAG